eukprot:260694-Chlamydomonas_euryale.AAC.1
MQRRLAAPMQRIQVAPMQRGHEARQHRHTAAPCRPRRTRPTPSTTTMPRPTRRPPAPGAGTTAPPPRRGCCWALSAGERHRAPRVAGRVPLCGAPTDVASRSKRSKRLLPPRQPVPLGPRAGCRSLPPCRRRRCAPTVLFRQVRGTQPHCV